MSERHPSYVFKERPRGSVISPRHESNEAARTTVGWLASQFVARDSAGNEMRGRTPWFGMGRRWTVTNRDSSVRLEVVKQLVRSEASAHLSGVRLPGARVLMRGGPCSVLHAISEDGEMVLQLVPDTNARGQRQFTMTLFDEQLPLLEAVCLVQVWRLLVPGFWMSDPSYGASQSGTYT